MTSSGIRLLFFSAAALALAGPFSAMAATDDASKTYHCGDGFKMEVFQPTDGMMEARVEDLTVQISVRDGGSLNRARYSVSLEVMGSTSSTGAETADEVLSVACRLISQYYENQKAPSGEELRKGLSELYEHL